MSKIEKAVSWMEKTAKNDSHGYDQKYRWGEKGDYDCSAAVITACEQAGIPVKKNGATYTGNILTVFKKTGFKDVTDKVNRATGAGLLRGDVLLAQNHHVAMYCGQGKEVEASINEKGKAIGGIPGDQTGKEFLIRSYRNYPWTHVLRFEEKAATTEKAESKPQNAKKTTTGQKLKVTATSGLNLRKSPGMKSPILKVLSKNTEVTWTGVIKETNGKKWYKVEHRGTTGYACADWLKKV